MDPGQELITETIHEWYDAKHRNISEEEIRFINSIQVDKCPACGNTRVIKSGFYDGIQRYKCKTCGIRFSALTNTIFEGKKIPISEWVEYLLHLFEFHSIISSARDNRNAETTGKYWLIKVFEVLKGIRKSNDNTDGGKMKKQKEYKVYENATVEELNSYMYAQIPGKGGAAKEVYDVVFNADGERITVSISMVEFNVLKEGDQLSPF